MHNHFIASESRSKMCETFPLDRGLAFEVLCKYAPVRPLPHSQMTHMSLILLVSMLRAHPGIFRPPTLLWQGCMMESEVAAHTFQNPLSYFLAVPIIKHHIRVEIQNPTSCC